MKLYRCDHCEKLIKEERDVRRVRIYLDSIGEIKKNNNKFSVGHLDLCSECFKKLKGVIKPVNGKEV